MGSKLIAGIVVIGAVFGVILLVSRKANAADIGPPPLPATNTRPSFCKTTVEAGGVAAGATGNPYALAGGLAANVASGPICDIGNAALDGAKKVANLAGGTKTAAVALASMPVGVTLVTGKLAYAGGKAVFGGEGALAKAYGQKYQDCITDKAAGKQGMWNTQFRKTYCEQYKVK